MYALLKIKLLFSGIFVTYVFSEYTIIETRVRQGVTFSADMFKLYHKMIPRKLEA